MANEDDRGQVQGASESVKKLNQSIERAVNAQRETTERLNRVAGASLTRQLNAVSAAAFTSQMNRVIGKKNQKIPVLIML